MAIKFFNIRNAETRVAETEPQIAALWASSDHSPNITQGQDFGWRLAPEVVQELKLIKQDLNQLTIIAQRTNKNMDELSESDILMYISARVAADRAPVATNDDYQEEYDQEVRRIGKAHEEDMRRKEAAEQDGNNPSPVTTTTTLSLEDLQKRVELEERLAAAQDKTSDKAKSTTTTTTKK